MRTICHNRSVLELPFILVTGYSGQAGEKEKIFESGVDAVVDKPLNRGKLLEAVREVVMRSKPKDSNK